MSFIQSKMYIHEGLGLLFGAIEDKDGATVHHYAVISLDAMQNHDMDALVSVSITDDMPDEDVYPAVRKIAQQTGIDLTEEEFDWCCQKLGSAEA